MTREELKVELEALPKRFDPALEADVVLLLGNPAIGDIEVLRNVSPEVAQGMLLGALSGYGATVERITVEPESSKDVN
jgi:hypothetical protein